MSMDYIRHFYGIPIKRFMQVRPIETPDQVGEISCANHYVKVKFPKYHNGVPFHPLTLEYFIDGKWQRFDKGK